MVTSKLFDKIKICALAIRHVHGIEQNESSYNEVMDSAPRRTKTTKHANTNLTNACVEFIRAGFVKRDTPDRKVKIAMCVAVSIADGRAEDGLVKAICDRFRGLKDYDRTVMTEIFNLSILNDRVLVLLDNAMILRKKNTHADIQHELRVEFILIYFGIVESALRREESLDSLGYITRARPSEMKTSREILEKHLSSIAKMCGASFNIGALKKERPRINLCPSNGGLPQATIGCDHIGFDEATVDTLKDCLFDTDKKEEFLDIIFAIISHSHKQPHDTFAGIKTETASKFFMDKILDKAEVNTVLKAFSNSGDKAASQDVVDPGQEITQIKEQLVKAREEISRLKSLCDDQKKQQQLVGAQGVAMRTAEKLAEANKEISRLKSWCDDQKKQQLADANREKRRFKELTDELAEKSELLAEANEATTRIEKQFEDHVKQLDDSYGRKTKRSKIDFNALQLSMSEF